MTALIIIAIIAALLAVLCMVSVGVSLSFYEGKLHLALKAWAKQIPVLPKEHDKSEKPRKTDDSASNKKKKRLPFSFDDYVQIVRIVLKALNRLRRRLYFDRIRLKYIAAGADPYETVLRYSAVCAALDSLAPAFENAVRVKEREIDISTDFDAEKTVFGFDFSLSIRIGSLLGLALLAALSLIKVYITSILRQKGKKGNG